MAVDRLSASDALLWRIEADPVLRSPIVVVGTLDRRPTWARVVAAATRAADAIPRLRCRIVDGGLLERARWEPDRDFDVEHHLRRTPVAGGLDAVLRLAEADAAAAFPADRPPWTFTVVEASDGTAAFVLRFHHAISDGVGAVGLAEHLLDRARRPPAATRAPAAPTRAPAPAPAGAAGRRRPVLAGAGLAAARAVTDPFGTARGVDRFVRSLARVLEGAPAPLSPALVGRSTDRRLHVIERPLADVRAAASVAGGTVNDAFLAAVGGGLHRYHDAVGAPVAALRLTVPISVRDDDDAAGGNRFAPARFVLPIDDPDPRRRARLAGAVVRRWRTEPALGATSAIAGVLDRLPTPVLVGLFAGMLRGVDVDAVDVPGLRHAAYLGGARVERLWAFAPPTGAALSVTLLSHGPTAFVGVASDTAAVADPDLLAGCVETALDELLALAAPAAPAGAAGAAGPARRRPAVGATP